MNTLKKTVAVVLAVAMVLTMGIATSFAAFTDVQSTAGYAEAANILANLGVLTGYTDGSFKPNNTITRAEVAAVMVRVMNLQEQPGATPFTDVPSDHWAAGYINAAASAGVINGYGDGTFGPENNVLYEEVVKMIVCALGRDIQAQAGGYPAGYLSVANGEEITKGANGTVGQPATRATVAKIVYGALETPMMDPSEWGSTGNKYALNEDKTLLKGLGVEKVDAVVTGTYYTNSETSYDPEDRTITLTASKKLTYNGTDYDKDQEIGTFEEGGTAAGSMLGMATVAYVGEDDETGEDTIFAISAKGSKNKSTLVQGDNLAKLSELEGDPNDPDDKTTTAYKNARGTVYYWENGRSDRNPKAIEPDEGMLVYKNYVLDSNFEFTGKGDDDTHTAGTTFRDELDKGGIVEFIDNDGNNKFDYALISSYTKETVVDSVRVNDGVYRFVKMDGAGATIENYDPSEEGKLKLFLKGENYIDPSEIANGDTITVIGDENDNNIIIYKVSSNKVEGRSNNYDPDTERLTIAGQQYGKSPLFNVESLRQYNNNSGTFYLNADGLISFVDASSSAVGDYAYFIGAAEVEDGWDTVKEVKLVDANGAVKIYRLDDEKNVTVYNGGEGSTKMTGAEVFDMLNGQGSDAVNFDQNVGERVIKYGVSGNVLNKIVICNNYTKDIDFEDCDFSAEGNQYDAEDHSFGGNRFTENTVTFVVGKKNGEYRFSDPDYITVTKGYSKFVDRKKYKVATYSENDLVTAAVQVSGASEVDLTQNVFVVSSYQVDTDEEDDNAIVTFTGYQNGATRTFQLKDDEVDGEANNIADDGNTLGKGTVLLVGPEVNGFVDRIQYLVKVTRDINANAVESIDATTEAVETDDDENIYYSGTTELQVYTYNIDNPNEDPVYIKNGYVNVDATTNERGYKADSRTTVTLVDFTPTRYTAATVRSRNNGDLSDVDVYPDDYDFEMFYRVYDGKAGADIYTDRTKVKDIVLYKFEKGDNIVAGGSAPANPEWSGSRYDNDDYDNGGSTTIPTEEEEYNDNSADNGGSVDINNLFK